MHPKEFTIDWKAFYDKAEELTASTRKELPNHLDLAYGSHRKQKLDVYLPVAKPSNAPVFLFLHGGGGREGDRLQYGYVARPFAAHGIITVVASYRLKPEVKFIEQVEDTHNALAWIFHNISKYGGDATRIYVGGHSAGAALTTYASLDGDWLKPMSLPADLIKGAVPISGGAGGILPPTTPPAPEDVRPILDVKTLPPHIIVSVGSVEPSLDASRTLVEKLQHQGAHVEFVVQEGQDHAQIVAALGDQNSKLFQAILKMITAQSLRASGK
jgi:acetyl esterase/lipase